MKRKTRTIVALAIALTTIGLFRTVSALSEDKPGAAPMTDGSPVADPPAPEAGVSSPAAYSVPAATTPPAGTVCMPGWSYFDNPAMHFGLCTPPGWGFTEYTSAAPLTSVRSQTLTDLHLASPDSFPWPAGDSSFDGIVNRGTSEIELDLFDPSAGNEGGCAFGTMQENGQAYTACYQELDATGNPTDSGPIRTLSVQLPLASAVTSVDAYPAPDGAKLVAILRGPSANFTTVEDLAWKLVASVNAY